MAESMQDGNRSPKPHRSSSGSAGSGWHAMTAGYFGWAMDSFDFFTLVFLVDTLATRFQVSKAAIVWTITITLAMRPVGAVLFGLLTDRYGRRGPLMGVVIFFSVIEFLCGFAPGYAVFLLLRALYGIGMGGEWGVGASLAMESVPARRRGIVSGFLQSGYPVGYLLAALAARFLLPVAGWRAMFWVGGAVGALLPFYIWKFVPESEAWKQHRAPSTGAIIRTTFKDPKNLIYLAVMMTLMMCLSHGSQDLYPDFLMSAHHISSRAMSEMAILYNIGAVLGSMFFGQLSEMFGRRRIITAALGLCAISIPAWAFGGSWAMLAAGSFVMQVGAQGAWGIIPAHLNELSPDAVRGLIPGFVYQLGILFASPTNSVEYALRDHLGYSWALTCFETVTIALLAIVLCFGPERKGRSFLRQAAVEDEAIISP
jgi:MFS transporter, SHS family, lactate transporter